MADKKFLVTTNAHAASLVTRKVAKRDDKGNVVLDKDKNPIPVDAEVKEEEVMAFQEYDDHVTVVTTGGEKLHCDKESEAWKKFATKAK